MCSFAKSAMLRSHVTAVVQSGQAKHWLLKGKSTNIVLGSTTPFVGRKKIWKPFEAPEEAVITRLQWCQSMDKSAVGNVGTGSQREEEWLCCIYFDL